MTLVTLSLMLAGAAHAETADEVVQKAREANQVDTSIQKMTMTIISSKGRERVREIDVRSKRADGEVSSYMEILSPSDVAGMKMLMIDHATVPDEQMIYMPDFKAVTRIAGTARKGSLFGSDFSYEDLDIREAADGAHSLLEETDTAWVIETIPTDSVQYSKLRSHIWKADLVAHKVEFFDKDGEAVKVLDVSKVEVDGEITLPVETTMSNLQKGTKTRLDITSHKLNVGEDELPADTFTQAYLER